MPARSLVLTLIIAFSSAAEAASFKSWAARAARQEREKDAAGAVESWSNAITLWRPSDGKPAKARAYCGRAALREAAGQDDLALQDYGECVANDKKQKKAFHRRGRLLMKAGRISSAIDDFYKAIALDIRFAEAYADRARALEAQGEKAFAQEDLKRACELGHSPSCAITRGKPKETKKKAPAPAPASKAAPTARTGAPVKVERREIVKPAPAPKPKPEFIPSFLECRAAMDACLETDTPRGCAEKVARCEKTPKKGCCPTACVSSLKVALNRGWSEAAAYRRIFASESACRAKIPEQEPD